LSRCLRVILVSGGRKCDALPGRLVGAGCRDSGHKGGCNCLDLGRMQIVLGGQLSGANSTNFAVCSVTVQLVLACFGWDGATATWHPMGKLVGDNKFVTVVGEAAC